MVAEVSTWCQDGDLVIRPITAHAAIGGPTSQVNPNFNNIQLSVNDLQKNSYFDGDKFLGGFGITQNYEMDYVTLRARSTQLFRDNLYARGLIRRLLTNVINTGLSLESKPSSEILGIDEDTLSDWTDLQEARFQLWAENPNLCDYTEAQSFGMLQETIMREAMIHGDVLIVLHISPNTGLPQVQVVPGSRIQSPDDASDNITHGVELDSRGRQVAYYVEQVDAEGNVTFESIPAFGPKSGRRLAWLVYGSDKLIEDVRGTPILGLILQSLKEIDRYRDSAQRKATVNSIIAGFIKKTEDKMGSLGISKGAVRKSTVTSTDVSGGTRRYNLAEQIPGFFMEELQTGEEPTVHSTGGTDINFGTFEESIVQAIAWAYETPPEILRLSFSSNYSASQAAINEYTMFLNKVRTHIGSGVLQPIYIEWFISEVLLQKISAPGFLKSINDPKAYDVYTAWTLSDWAGAVKPSANVLVQTKGYKLQVGEGFITHGRATRELTGTKFTSNIKCIERENRLKARAMRPLLELEQEFGQPAVQGAAEALGDAI